MDIKDCKVGTRVICVNPHCSNEIPVGAVGTIIENDTRIPWVSFDEKYSGAKHEICGHSNCKVMGLVELEVLEENPSEEDSSKETTIGKLTVSLATEDVNEIAKDILTVVLQELRAGIENLTKDLNECEVSGDVTPKESLVTEQDVLNNLLNQINSAINNYDDDTAVKLSEVYQRIKSVSINTAQKI